MKFEIRRKKARRRRVSWFEKNEWVADLRNLDFGINPNSFAFWKKESNPRTKKRWDWRNKLTILPAATFLSFAFRLSGIKLEPREGNWADAEAQFGSSIHSFLIWIYLFLRMKLIALNWLNEAEIISICVNEFRLLNLLLISWRGFGGAGKKWKQKQIKPEFNTRERKDVCWINLLILRMAFRGGIKLSFNLGKSRQERCRFLAATRNHSFFSLVELVFSSPLHSSNFNSFSFINSFHSLD